MRPPVGDRAAPPRLLDPILVAWEAFDRRRRRIRPIRAHGILGLERARHSHHIVVLTDGTRVRPGDPVGEIHLLNRRVRDLDTRPGLAQAFREGRADIRSLGAWAAGRPSALRPVAYHAEGIMARFAVRDGWEVRPRPLTPWQRVRDWYFRWLLVHWNPARRERLRHGRGPLGSVDAWLSADQLRHRTERATGGAPGPPTNRTDKPAPSTHRTDQPAP